MLTPGKSKEPDSLRSHIIDKGTGLIRRFGYKKTTVEDITRASGIAKGSFYKYFSSKEEFVFEIINHNRQIFLDIYRQMLEKHGGALDREAFRTFLLRMLRKDSNIYSDLTPEDRAILSVRWPKEYWFNPEVDEQVTTWLLEHTTGRREGVEWQVVANFMKILSIGCYDRELLHQDKLPETVAAYIEGMVSYIFGPKGTV